MPEYLSYTRRISSVNENDNRNNLAKLIQSPILPNQRRPATANQYPCANSACINQPGTNNRGITPPNFAQAPRPGRPDVSLGSITRTIPQQCQASNFPPNPNTGCCGVDTFGINGVTGKYLLNAPMPKHNVYIMMARKLKVSKSWFIFTDAQTVVAGMANLPLSNIRMKRQSDNDKVEIELDNRIAGMSVKWIWTKHIRK